MDVQLEKVRIGVGDAALGGTVLRPARELPGVLFVHGWGGSQLHDLARAKEAAGLGCICVTFDLRGHAADARESATVTRAQNLTDLVAAYDWLAGQPNVDADAIAVVGISYGGYLATLLTAQRRVRWLALRSPAIYKDAHWERPKLSLNQDPDLPSYRRQRIAPADNRALQAAAAFDGDVLIVEAGRDEVIPHAVIENYLAAFGKARSLTARTLADADHGFSAKSMQRDYTQVLLKWLTEMVTGARASAATSTVESHKKDLRAAGAAPAPLRRNA